MGIILPDLIIETTIRDGLAFLGDNPDRIDEIFEEMLEGYASRKYGQAEIDRIKTFLQKKNIAVVHSFHEAAAKSPCYSIQLASESEATNRAHLEDFEEDVQVQLTAPADLAALIRVNNLVPTAYDPLSGKVSVPDSADLSTVGVKFIYEDGSGTEFELKPGISNVDGNKFFFIDKNATPDIVNPGFIRTFLDYTQHQVKGDTSRASILIGAHSKEALLTKYMYVVLKHIMKSRKEDLIKRCFINSTFSGSDFTRDTRYQGDMVFTRYFTITGDVDDTWRTDDIELIDQIEIQAEPAEDC